MECMALYLHGTVVAAFGQPADMLDHKGEVNVTTKQGGELEYSGANAVIGM